MAAIREPVNRGVEGVLSILAVLYFIASMIAGLTSFPMNSVGAFFVFAQGVVCYALFAAISQGLKHLRNIQVATRASLEVLSTGRALYVCGACGHVTGDVGECPSCNAKLKEQMMVRTTVPPPGAAAGSTGIAGTSSLRGRQTFAVRRSRR